MATYVIGDVQGCFNTLQKLLETIKFDSRMDRVIFLGDVINRGPYSLEVLRFIKKHDNSMEMILGNHEIFAIALDLGAVNAERAHTMHALLSAPDKDELMNFLRKQPLIKRYDQNIFVHAGILPAISLDDAFTAAHEISKLLQSEQAKKFLERYYQKTPTVLRPDLKPKKALRLALAYFTLIRMCESTHIMDLSYSGVMDKAPKRLKPWFLLRDDGPFNIYFGHWAALGLYKYKNYQCLDSGCAWGQQLTSLRLSDNQIFQVNNLDKIQ